MFKIQCPNCGHDMQIKQLKAGRYRPNCKRCQQPFELTLASAADALPVVAKLADAGPAADTEPTRSLPSETRRGSTTQRAGETRVDESAGETFVTRETSIPDRLGGYKIVRELGRGGLGVVYLARQLSLDRDVALKVIQGQWAGNSKIIARFIREAYSAAQLVHHNVVQIYDLGRQQDTNFFSMEFVPGQNLAELVKRTGHLDQEQAIGYILQAARGLQFAHQQGMVHRDVKPANLLLNEQGIVKVADLGLVKLPAGVDEESTTDIPQLSSSANLTVAGSTVGTAKYMAPEQIADAAAVDHRADIYSLGCSLYVLLTGKPPFSGTTIDEVVSKHRDEPVVRPEQFVEQVDPRISDIVVKMMAKRPEDRYANLGEVIHDLESFLGIKDSAVFSPNQEQIATLEKSCQAFNNGPLVKARAYLPLAFGGAVVVLSLFLALLSWRWASAAASLLVISPLAYFLISGWNERTELFKKARVLAAHLKWRRWAQLFLAFLLGATVVWLFGALGPWVLAGALGAGLSVAYYFLVDRQLNQQRAGVLQPIHDLLKRQRIAGIDEHSLHRFVAKYSGKHWEELFETLFGYDALQKARADLAGSQMAAGRRRFRPWRDWIIERLDTRLTEMRSFRDQQTLQQVEQVALIDAGRSPDEAENEAEQIAIALVKQAAQWKVAASERSVPQTGDPGDIAERKRARIKAMLADARSGKYRRRKSLVEKLEEPLDLLLGSHVRLILGCLLIIGCVLWIRQNGIFDSVTAADVTAAAQSAVEGQGANLKEVAERVGIAEDLRTEPLKWPLVGRWFDSFGPGIAGLLLVISAFFRGWKMSMFLLPAAAIVWFGPALGIPAMLPWGGAASTSALIGIIVAVAGLLLGRTKF